MPIRTAPWLAALAVLTLARFAVAAAVPLSPDEAYYWVWSRALAPGYLDHPPMVALWIRAGTWIAGNGTLGVRLLGPASACLGSALLWDAAARLLRSPGAGVVAAALLNATLFLGAGAVTMTPDTPLLFFWTATLWAVVRARQPDRAGWWLATGVLGGCALASKYTAALLGAGLVLWLAATREGRAWACRWQPWAGGALALAVSSPVLAWNAAHEWASLAKQGGRTSDWRPAHAIRFLGELIGGQAALATRMHERYIFNAVALATPLVFALCVWGTWRVSKAALSTTPRTGRESGAAGLLACLTLLPAAVFVEHALGDRVQGNWPAVVYPSACIAAAGLGSLLWRSAAALGLAVTAAAYVQAAAPPIALPRALDPTLIRLAGWPSLAREVAAEAERSGAAFITAEPYGLLAELAYDAPTSLPVVAAGPRWSLIRLRAAPAGASGDDTGLLVETARRREPPDPALWDVIAPSGTLDRARGGVIAETYRLYRVRPRQGTVLVLLPRPEAP